MSVFGEIACQTVVKHQVSWFQIASPGRTVALVRARHEFFYRALSETNMPTSSIGAYCGGVDHSTVLYGAGKHALRNNLPFPRGAAWTHAKYGRVAA